MKVNICATPVSVAAFVVANVRDNVRLQQLQDYCYYDIQKEGNCSRGCNDGRGIYFLGWGRGKVGTSIVGIFGRWEGVSNICLCMLTSGCLVRM